MKIMKNLMYLVLANTTLNVNCMKEIYPGDPAFACGINKTLIIARENEDRRINEYGQDEQLMNKFIEESGEEVQKLVKFFCRMNKKNKTNTPIFDYKQSLFHTILRNYVSHEQTCNYPIGAFERNQYSQHIRDNIKTFDLEYKKQHGQWADDWNDNSDSE